MPTRSTILSIDALTEQVDYFVRQDAYAFDCETKGPARLQPTRNEVFWISFATYGRAFSLPLGHPIGNRVIRQEKVPTMGPSGKVRNVTVPIWEDPPRQLRWVDVIPVLEPLFANDALKIGHNLPFDLMSVAKYFDGKPPAPPYQDNMVVQWLLNENLKPRGLKDFNKRFFDIQYEKLGKEVEKHPFFKAARYAFMDARTTWMHAQRLQGQITQGGFDDLWALEQEITEVVVSMSLTGVPIDVALVEELERKFGKRLIELEADIYRAAGRTFNIASPPQRAEILFGKPPHGQGLKPIKFTDKGGAPSTDKEALAPYATNPVVKAMSEHGVVEKLQGTYVKSWLGTNDPSKPPQVVEGRIHATFRQSGADTGRFSSSDPNVQNIPVRSLEGRQLRGAFIGGSGYRMIVADYDQIELRILAHFAGHGRLWDAFMNGEDPHAATAAAVFGIPIDQVTSQQRSAGKGSNFAVIYGAMAETVASTYGIPLSLARKFLTEHPKYFPEVYAFKDEVISVCKSRRPPYVQTILGRRRRLPEIWSRNRKVSSGAERQAVNAVVQGSNADMIKKSMVLLHRKAKAQLPDFRLVMTVHDELVSLCPADRIEEGIQLVKDAMLGPEIQGLLRVPVTAEIKVVDRWSEAK